MILTNELTKSLIHRVGEEQRILLGKVSDHQDVVTTDIDIVESKLCELCLRPGDK